MRRSIKAFSPLIGRFVKNFDKTSEPQEFYIVHYAYEFKYDIKKPKKEKKILHENRKMFYKNII